MKLKSRKTIFFLVVATFFIAFLFLNLGAVGRGGASEQKNYRDLLQSLDGSIVSLRHGRSISLSDAQTLYTTLVEPYGGEIENRPELTELNTRIMDAFGRSRTEEEIRSLRSDISTMMSELGIGLSPIYEYSVFVILGIGMVVSLLITLLNRRLVNWERIRQIKAEVAAFQKELREAQTRRDPRRIHKLQMDQKRILSLQGEMMRERAKPTFFFAALYFVFWVILGRIYSGWVVAWLPFRLTLPFFGLWASCGFLSWYLLTYFGFSQIWWKLFIRE